MEARTRAPALLGMVDPDEHIVLNHLRLVENLITLEHRSNRDIRVVEQLQPFFRGPRLEDRLDNRVYLLAEVPGAVVGQLRAGVFSDVRQVEHHAQP